MALLYQAKQFLCVHVVFWHSTPFGLCQMSLQDKVSKTNINPIKWGSLFDVQQILGTAFHMKYVCNWEIDELGHMQ